MGLDRPTVAIVGGGAMGGLFGGLMAEKGLDVTLIDVWREHVDAIRAHGLRIVGVGGDRAIRIGATADASTLKSADVVLFQCKAFANRRAAESVRHLFKGATVAISFQNGLGNEEALAEVLGAPNVMGGLTAQAGRVEQPGVVRNFGVNTHASADIRRDKWKKLLGNVGRSALSGVTDLRSMDIMAVPELQAVVFRAVDEAAAVARAEGIDLDTAEARSVLMTLTVSKDGGTGTAKSSLNGDLLNRRPTEVDYIYGTVARLGRARGVPTPTIDTLIGIVKGLESKYLARPKG